MTESPYQNGGYQSAGQVPREPDRAQSPAHQSFEGGEHSAHGGQTTQPTYSAQSAQDQLGSESAAQEQSYQLFGQTTASFAHQPEPFGQPLETASQSPQASFGQPNESSSQFTQHSYGQSYQSANHESQPPEPRTEPVMPASVGHSNTPTYGLSATSGEARTETGAHGTHHAPVFASPSEPTATAHAQHDAASSSASSSATSVATPAKQKGTSTGKTFLFGFLGALVACVIALGGYTLASGGLSTTSPASTYIGTQDSSIIEATEEGSTLAEAVAAKTLPSVVAVYNYQTQTSSNILGYGVGNNQAGELAASGMGSGVVISDDGYIITNYHVVDGAEKVTVHFNGEERDATYVGGDSSSDIAVIKVDDTSGLQAADIGNSDSLRIGEWVMTVGAPLGLEQSVATGVVSATNRSTYMDSSSSNANSLYLQSTPEYTYYPNMIQTDAVINPGNSGGALVDADGKLIGINAVISSYSGDYAGVGFAIPVNYAIGIATDIIAGKTPTHAMLGVSISTVNSQNAQRYGFAAKSGAYINSITPGTGAADSDLREGDIITAIDGTEVTSATDVTLEVRSHNVGDTVTVTVDRNGSEHNVDVVLSSDELIANNSNNSDDSNSPQNPQTPNDNGNGNSGGNGYSRDDIERFLRLFGF